MNYYNNYTPEDFINDGYKKIGNHYYKVEGNTLAIGRDDDWVSKYDPALMTNYFTIEDGQFEYAGPGSSGTLEAEEGFDILLSTISNILKDVK